MTKQDLMEFFAWADKRGLAFGEFVESNGQTWFHEQIGSRLEETVERFLARHEVPPKPDYAPFGTEASTWWVANVEQKAV